MSGKRRAARAGEMAPPGPGASLEIAARYLAVRPRSRWEVEQRLVRAGASEEVVGETLERLAELGLVDDIAFARWWLDQRDRHAPRGRRLVEAELRQHRVGPSVIEQLRDEIASLGAMGQDEAEQQVPRTEEERARAALAAHLRGRPLPEDPKALQRLGMFLVRRGFEPDTVRSALRAAPGSEDGD